MTNFRKLKEENYKLKEIIRSLVMEKDEEKIIKKVKELRKKWIGKYHL